MTDVDDYVSQPRSAQEAARRALALIAVTSRANRNTEGGLLEWVTANGIHSFFSDQERKFFFQAEAPTDRDVTDFRWRVEALVSILWALRGIDTFPPLHERVDLRLVDAVKRAVDEPRQFLLEAELRPAEEIAELEGEVYHQHWRVRDAQLFRRPMPPELDPSVVYERRYALSWLTGDGDDWDDVPTDT